MTNIFFIIGGLIFVLLFLMSVAIIHIRALRDEINLEWYNLADKLQYRQDLIPNLIETIRIVVPEESKQKAEVFIQDAIRIRAAAAKNSKAGAEKIVQEHDLSTAINKLFELENMIPELKTNIGFLELKKEIREFNDQINELSKEYNTRVRHHNSVLRRPYNIFPAMLIKYGRKQIFEFE